MKRDVIAELVPAPVVDGDRADLAELFFELSRRGDLAGHEVTQRFFEIGSPAGLQDFEQWTRARS
jgi:hypothetical protein